VVSLTRRPLYRQGKSPWYPLDRRLGGPQSHSGRGGEERNPQPPPGIEPYNPYRPARSPALYRLSYRAKYFILRRTFSLQNVLLFSRKWPSRSEYKHEPIITPMTRGQNVSTINMLRDMTDLFIFRLCQQDKYIKPHINDTVLFIIARRLRM
jgi:hypothetical protein